MDAKKDQQIFYAKVAGCSYVLFTLSGLFKNFALNTQLQKYELVQSGIFFVSEVQFRLGVAVEAFMFLATLMASVAFYIVLKPLNNQLALLSLCLRLCEVILGSLAVVASVFILALSKDAIALFDLEYFHHVILVISKSRLPAYEVSWIFMGSAGIITFYMFLRARYLPTAFCYWGILTYSSLIVYPLTKVLISNLPKEFMVVMFPGALFELLVGFWLLIKGVAIHERFNLVALS